MQANNPIEQISSAHSYSLRKQPVLCKVQYLEITAFLESFHGRSSLVWSVKDCGWSSAFWDRKPFWQGRNTMLTGMHDATSAEWIGRKLFGWKWGMWNGAIENETGKLLDEGRDMGISTLSFSGKWMENNQNHLHRNVTQHSKGKPGRGHVVNMWCRDHKRVDGEESFEIIHIGNMGT